MHSVHLRCLMTGSHEVVLLIANLASDYIAKLHLIQPLASEMDVMTQYFEDEPLSNYAIYCVITPRQKKKKNTIKKHNKLKSKTQGNTGLPVYLYFLCVSLCFATASNVHPVMAD